MIKVLSADTSYEYSKLEGGHAKWQHAATISHHCFHGYRRATATRFLCVRACSALGARGVPSCQFCKCAAAENKLSGPRNAVQTTRCFSISMLQAHANLQGSFPVAHTWQSYEASTCALQCTQRTIANANETLYHRQLHSTCVIHQMVHLNSFFR